MKLEELLTRPEGKTLEFKQDLSSPKNILKTLTAFANMAGIKQGFAQFFGGTSLLIMVGVLLDTLQQIESHLLMRHYDGLMKSGRIKGRNQGAAYGMAG